MSWKAHGSSVKNTVDEQADYGALGLICRQSWYSRIGFSFTPAAT
jgi:hypothetical protein